ncbi:MAG: imelysin family protein [Bacteroidota bacterium]
MRKFYLKKTITAFSVLCFVLSTCVPNQGFDRKNLLNNFAENIILPATSAVVNSAKEFNNTIELLQARKDSTSLLNAQKAWDQLYQDWIKVGFLNFGPGGSEGRRRTLAEEVASWPVSTDEIEQKISAGDFGLDDAKRNSRGLLAIEYLLFAEEPSDFLSATDLALRLSYLQAITSQVVAQLGQFQDTWEKTYLQDFISNDGTSVKSSVTLVYNEIVKALETNRDIRLGIPMGFIAGQSGPQPDLAEARFSQKSINYLFLHHRSLINFWRGIGADGVDRPGLEDYLGAVQGGQDLADRINLRLTEVERTMNNVPLDQTFRTLAGEGNADLNDLHGQFKALTPLFKGESSSLLGLAITFSSGDGD